VSDLLQELADFSGRWDLSEIGYSDLMSFLVKQQFSDASLEVYDSWRTAFFSTENGREQIEALTPQLVRFDVKRLERLLRTWRRTGRVQPVLEHFQRVAANELGLYSRETVEQAQKFLAFYSMRRIRIIEGRSGSDCSRSGTSI
jgi:hypothetical protein